MKNLKKIFFILFVTIFIASCSSKWNCNSSWWVWDSKNKKCLTNPEEICIQNWWNKICEKAL